MIELGLGDRGPPAFPHVLSPLLDPLAPTTVDALSPLVKPPGQILVAGCDMRRGSEEEIDETFGLHDDVSCLRHADCSDTDAAQAAAYAMKSAHLEADTENCGPSISLESRTWTASVRYATSTQGSPPQDESRRSPMRRRASTELCGKVTSRCAPSRRGTRRSSRAGLTVVSDEW
ncbi:hypothetical protein GCM10023080_044520 [Streptomyces pseudoechinosporeus]